MPLIQYGIGAYRRDQGNMPELKLVNFFVEKTPVTEGQVTLQSRRGLTQSYTAGTGPVRGIFQQDGSFSGDTFTVSSGTLYRGAASIGAITGSGHVSFACSGSELLVCAGASLYSYNGTNLVAVTFPDADNVIAVAFIAGLFVAIPANSQKFYWSAVLDGRTWGALDFASAELAPDNLLDALAFQGSLFLFGQDTIETWYPNGSLDLPFTRIDQRLYSRGVHSTGCCAILDNAPFFVADDGVLYRLSDVPERLSDHGIEERISASSSVICYAYSFEGHKFFVVRLDSNSYQYDVATGQFSELASYGRTNFAARCAVNVDAIPYFGDDTAGKVWAFGSSYQDDGGTMEGIFSAGFHTTVPVFIDTLEVVANVGWTDALGGADPVIEMRQSRDTGATWSGWRDASLGGQGHYRTRARYRRNGMFDSPGGLFEFRISDPTPRRISGVYVNEPGGGRSR